MLIPLRLPEARVAIDEIRIVCTLVQLSALKTLSVIVPDGVNHQWGEFV